MSEKSIEIKNHDRSLSIVTGNSVKLEKTASDNMSNTSEGENFPKMIKNHEFKQITSLDDLSEPRRSLYSCYSSKAINVYDNSSQKEYSGSIPNFLTYSRTIKNNKMSRSCSGEEKSIRSNCSGSSQTVHGNLSSSTKLKSIKEKIFSKNNK